MTGPGMRQITKLSWAEARTRIINAREPLPGELLHTELRIDDQHYAICIPSKDPDHLRVTGCRLHPRLVAHQTDSTRFPLPGHTTAGHQTP